MKITSTLELLGRTWIFCEPQISKKRKKCYNIVMNLAILIIASLIFIETTTLLVAQKTKLLNKSAKRKIYIDTSALIDGRILSIARTGFIGDDLIILKSVLRELQL